MHAFLLINSDPLEFAKKENAKVFLFVLQKIDDVRELKKLVKFSFAEKTAIVIENIDMASDEALNAFLKILEEPTKNIIYILTANNLSNVLPTITSRCQVIQVKQILQILQKKNINYDAKSNYKDALNIKDRDEAIKFIENLLLIEHQNKVFDNMENYLKTIRALKLNGNVSLQLINLVVTMNRDGR